MKLSDLIRDLEFMKQVHGDQKVYVMPDNQEGDCQSEIAEVVMYDNSINIVLEPDA